MSDIKTVTLARPIPYGDGKTLDRLQFRRPKAGDLRGIRLARIDDADVNTILTLAPRLSMTPVSEGQLAELDPPDFVEVAGTITDFFRPLSTPSRTTQEPPGDC